MELRSSNCKLNPLPPDPFRHQDSAIAQPVIRDITETAISYTGCSPNDLTVSYSFLGTFDRRTGAADATFTSTGDVTWTRNFSLKCKPTR